MDIRFLTKEFLLIVIILVSGCSNKDVNKSKGKDINLNDYSVKDDDKDKDDVKDKDKDVDNDVDNGVDRKSVV